MTHRKNFPSERNSQKKDGDDDDGSEQTETPTTVMNGLISSKDFKDHRGTRESCANSTRCTCHQSLWMVCRMAA